MAKIRINKDNYKKFSASALFPGKENVTNEAQIERLNKNLDLLLSAEHAYNSLHEFRDKRAECVAYYMGDQLSRLIPDPDHDGCSISIFNYCVKQGMTPLTLNLITSRIRALVGSYEKKKLEDLVVARDRDEQKLGEMMSVAMEYVYQHADLYRANADGYREFLLGALVPFKTGYDWNSERKLSEVYADLSDVNVMFWDSNTSGRYFENVTMIGELHEFTLLQLLKKFAKTPTLRNLILRAYDESRIQYSPDQQFEKDINKRHVSFFTPRDPQKYRVIEIWNQEDREVIECTDVLAEDGVVNYTINVNQLQDILIRNEQRKQQIVSYGGNAEDAQLIKYQYRVDSVWVVRYLTPSGHVLYEAESPYEHGGHPWAIGAYPMVDGQVQSLTYDLIPAQDMVNRVLMRSEYVQMNKAKGFGLVEKRVLEDSGITQEEFARKYTSPRAIIAVDSTNVGGLDKVFKRFNDDNMGGQYDLQMFQTYVNLINQQSGSTEASRGEQGGSHESASRYMMETENSNNNTADGEMWFNGLVTRRDQKIMKLIQQYWEDNRYINIAGNTYSEESKVFNSEKIRNTLMDLSIIQSPSSGAVRFQAEDMLKTLFESQAIDANTWLESTSMYGADKVLERKKAHEKEMEKEQAALQAQQAQVAQQPIQ